MKYDCIAIRKHMSVMLRRAQCIDTKILNLPLHV